MRWVILLFLSGCRAPLHPAQVPYAALPGPEQRLDPLLGELSLPPLAGATLPAGYRELRLSRGAGMILGGPNPVIRITTGPDRVTGEVILYHAVLTPTDSQPRIVRWAAEIVRPRHRIDWRQALTVLDTLGVEVLVSPRYSPAWMDAGDLVVEVRNRSSYRAYEFNAPGKRSDPLGRRAARIAQIVDSLVREAR